MYAINNEHQLLARGRKLEGIFQYILSSKTHYLIWSNIDKSRVAVADKAITMILLDGFTYPAPILWSIDAGGGEDCEIKSLKLFQAGYRNINKFYQGDHAFLYGF